MRKYLRQLREKKHLTQTQTAEALNITQHYYSMIEKGERQKDLSFSTLVGLSKVFNVSLSRLTKAETEYQCHQKEVN